MKKSMSKITSILAVVILVGLSAFTTSEPNTFWLDEAISKNLISADFICNEKSVHYEKPLIAVLVNRTSRPIKVKIPVGMVFSADNDEEQDIIVTQNRMASLQPNVTKRTAISGNCMEHNDAAGSEGSTYSLQGASSPKLKKLVHFIAKNKVSPSLGQKAVWCITDDEGLETIYDKDNEVASELRSLVSTLTGKPLPAPETFNSYEYNYEAEPLIAVRGSMNFMFSYDCKVEVSMFDMQGRMVRELFRSDHVTKGKHRLTYQFDNSVYTDKSYEIKVIRNSEVIFNRLVDLS
ncbi:hypothetical protein N9595_02040 [Bacteroidia bacterium]|nr:hypothetical protein [Bacteroidia bacterium]